MKAYMFPGQGSQRKGMGEGLFDEFPDLTRQADETLGFSIKELCLQDPEQKLNQTQYTQPALYTVNVLSYLKKIRDTGQKPDFLAGHSLGEYSALHVAGAFTFETGLRLVKKRGELMGMAAPGAMAAIINCAESRIRGILSESGLEAIDIANLNAPSQTIISGSKEDIGRAQAFFEKEDAKFIPLNTSGAFHSRYMREAAAEFAEFAMQCELTGPGIPVISNVTARPYEQEHVARNLVDQITSAVRWTDSVLYLLDRGVVDFEEMGVGDVLTKLIGQIRRTWTPAAAPEHGPVAGTGTGTGAADMVELWNRKYPVGSRATSDLYGEELQTRTEAVVLFGHRAAVYMKGYNGYFDLRELKPVG